VHFLFLSLIISTNLFAQFSIQGEWIKKRKHELRYVSHYEVKKIKRPLVNFPWIQEDCHDQGNRFANWSKSLSYEIVYSGAISFNLLGLLDIDLGKENTKTIEFTFQRWITPTEGIKAKHVIFEEFEIWEGHTQAEYREGDNIERGEEVFPFKLQKINYGISVQRIETEDCYP
jgi:hypothetical protein